MILKKHLEAKKETREFIKVSKLVDILINIKVMKKYVISTPHVQKKMSGRLNLCNRDRVRLHGLS